MRLAGAAFAGGLVLALLSGEVPQFVFGGSNPIRHAPLPQDARLPISLPYGADVVFEGDSNIAGSRVGGSAYAFPAIFRRETGSGFVVANIGVGGATADDWPEQPREAAAMFVIMLGSNDAAPRGLLSRRKPVDLVRYEARLKALATRRIASGARVLLLAPPPAGSTAMDRRIHPYRLAAQRAAFEAGASFADPVEAFDREKELVALQHDALHLSRAGHLLLGKWLASRIVLQPMTDVTLNEGTSDGRVSLVHS
ncbi:SGNH/GDSL hydrolase family protein [Novosphingobium sp. SL115]|uniref:SGNH/GDSL hydrolase family protein n=1 Tax=Novosphingobium sp. SL115 TaxID=2995150 RepID=UPI002272E946|nr:SGNH/GDSL hydrolase family protein [Novosphingobium sp. SL115]MCY1670651.1 SGNH/GDSL hydrolase family protein [Novosphingobium sp. SL115]